MAGLMNSLVVTLEGTRDRALALMTELTVTREPEVLCYLARQCAMIDAVDESLEMLRRARSEGLTSSYALAHDDVFKRLRSDAAFCRELDEARRVEIETRRMLQRAGLDRLVKEDTSVRLLSNE
jgi:hypothetical protein